ncbi:MAG: GNAT family N-acetyltransferase [Candidatus Sphingomonas phytovorans]|nr:GNAT family N-acetyltransferase [Sphingomonas sp.]WEK01884.1 MAG: GNAT family N-acetyltransferase [Sphingomonas sp.]
MFARTARLTLRPGWPEDAQALTHAIAHEEVVTKLSRAPWPYTVDDAEEFLASPREAHDARFLILSHEADYPRIVGSVAVWFQEDAYELGYWLTPSAWGRGYATEAGRAVLQMAHHALGVKHVRAGHFVDNPASGRVLTKLGFRPTGAVVPRHSRARDAEVPCAVFELDLDEDRMCDVKMAA